MGAGFENVQARSVNRRRDMKYFVFQTNLVVVLQDVVVTEVSQPGYFTLLSTSLIHTGLKPGVNETAVKFAGWTRHC